MAVRVFFVCLLLVLQGFAQQATQQPGAPAPPQQPGAPAPSQQPGAPAPISSQPANSSDAAASPAAGAPPSGSIPQPIKVQVNEVIVPVTVTDEKGKFVSNLDQKDFQILDQGQPQTIQYFTRERNQPVVVGFLIDLSNSSRTQWKNFEQASEDMVLQMLPDNPKFSGYLIGYSNESELMVNTTTSPEKILEKLRKVKPGGGAAFYDAIYQACTSRDLVQGEPVEPRRIIIVVGDGNDNSSKKTLEEVIELAQRNLVTVYGISTVSYGFTSPGDDNLVRLAEETGGRVEYPLQDVYKDVSGYQSVPSDEGNFALKVGTGGYASAISNSIFRAIANVSGDITTQYILRYTPNVTDASSKDAKRVFRTINVKVALGNVKVRARKGYYPFAP
jgi:Ca-activated chloride channel family protein